MAGGKLPDGRPGRRKTHPIWKNTTIVPDSVVSYIARFPESSRRCAGRSGVRAAPLGRYPYVIFYRVAGDAIEILYIHHAARQRRDNDG